MKKILSFLTAGLLALGLTAGLAFAQVPPQPPGVAALGGQTSLAVTATTGRVALPAACPAFCAITVYNAGDKTAFVKLGSSTVTAATTDTAVPAGLALVIWVASNTYIAGITGGADTTTLYIYQGNGPVLAGTP